MEDSLHTRFVSIIPARGTIFSKQGRMLSTSIPFFNIRMDMEADGLKENNGRAFRKNLDSLSICLADLFRDKTARQYRRLLNNAYQKKDRYFLLKSGVTFEQYEKMCRFPLFRLGPNKGGMIAETEERRVNPFRLLANRTVGLWRENAQNIGLEAAYNHYLSGITGKRLMRRISGGTFIPVKGYDIEPENGEDVRTNIDINIQDVAENALYQTLSANGAIHGACIVMEVKTGKIRAIANLGRQPDGSYYEDYNYSLMETEPGSTFKLATLLSILKDHLVTIHSLVDMHHGRLKFGNRTVKDAEQSDLTWVPLKKAFELSSNVAFSQMANLYHNDPDGFIHQLDQLKLNRPTGIDIPGEEKPVIITPGSKTWSSTTLPWMGFGYEVLVSPLLTLTLYNAIANNGTMMRPYLVNAIEKDGKVVKRFGPEVRIAKICSPTILAQVKDCLEGVVKEGTAKNIFIGAPYQVAGKTGTAMMANGRHGYADKIYQATFVGYFPADHPLYSCIVVIKNKPHAVKYYGADVAGPVFRAVADRIYAMDIRDQDPMPIIPHFDSTLVVKNGFAPALKQVLNKIGLPCQDSSQHHSWVSALAGKSRIKILPIPQPRGEMPNVQGMGLKDALFLLENAGLKVNIKGEGKVIAQSLPFGTPINKGQNITIELN
ncbi:MAG: penicillin-binding protein [Chitinophagaceae bacterium]